MDDSPLIENDIKLEDLEEQNDVDESKEVRGFPVLMFTMSIQGLGSWKAMKSLSRIRILIHSCIYLPVECSKKTFVLS